jgi:hypothetical protein
MLLAVLALGFSQGMRLTALAQTGDSAHLLEAAKAARIKVQREEVFSISRGSETFAAATIAGWEQIPTTELRKGVDIAFAYFSTADPKVPKGYFTLRAYADVTSVGTVVARVQLIDHKGKVAAEIPAEADIYSLTVPLAPASHRTFVTTAGARQIHDEDLMRRRGITICFCCSNGGCICFRILTV